MPNVALYERKLKNRLAELGHRLEDVEHELDQPMPQDSEDRAAEREGDEVLEELGHACEHEIAMILAALARIGNGAFGICVRCGEDILPARLEAVPHAPFCRHCARKTEDA